MPTEADPLRILVIYPDGRCGFRNYGDQLVTALRLAGHDVAGWRSAEFPPAMVTTAYDVIHLIWHPGTLTAQYTSFPFPPGPLYSIWVGEVPPYAACPMLDRFKVIMSHAPLTRGSADPFTQVFPYPAVDWIDPADLPGPDPLTFTVGCTGVRGEGVEELAEICHRHRWGFNDGPLEWLSVEQEIDRLSKSTLNVCWYGDRRQEQASAPAMCVASGRPLLINDAPMLQHAYWWPGTIKAEAPATLEEVLLRLQKYQAQLTLFKGQAPVSLLWSTVAREMVTCWRRSL